MAGMDSGLVWQLSFKISQISLLSHLCLLSILPSVLFLCDPISVTLSLSLALKGALWHRVYADQYRDTLPINPIQLLASQCYIHFRQSHPFSITFHLFSVTYRTSPFTFKILIHRSTVYFILLCFSGCGDHNSLLPHLCHGFQPCLCQLRVLPGSLQKQHGA